MIKNYLKIAWRNVLRNRVFSFINILGLSLGLASCLVLLAFVKHERSYDSFHPESEQVFRVIQTANSTSTWSWTGGALAPMLRKAFSENLDEVVSLHLTSTFISAPEGIDPEESFREDHFIFSDSGFEKVFGFELVQGSWTGLFENTFQLAITESAAKKYFGNDNPLGKVLLVDKTPYEVKAVIQDLPRNTHMKFDFVTSMSSFKALNGIPQTSEFGSFWWPQVFTYVKVKANQDPVQISKRIPEINGDFRNPEEAKNYVHFLQSISEIHLDTSLESDWTPSVSKRTLWIFLSIGVFVLILAAINFINLSTSRAIKRMKEIGIRKVSGANKGQLVTQFLAESFLINLIAVLLGLLIVFLSFPIINRALGMDIPFNLAEDLQLLFLLLSVWLSSSLLSGIFPAFYLSRLNPDMILKSTPFLGRRNSLRKTLVVFQFVLSTLLVFCASVAYFQHQFMANSSMGFDAENLVTVRMGYSNGNREVLKQELEKINGIESASLTSDQPGVEPGWSPSIDYPGMPVGAGENLRVQYIDQDYFKNLGIPLVSGREFTEEYNDQGIKSMMRERFAALDDLGIIVNESAAKWMSQDQSDVLGRDIRVFTEENGELFSNYKGKIVGVVKDYHIENLKKVIAPTVYLPVINSAFDGSRYLVIKGAKAMDEQLIESLSAQWKVLNPGLPFDFNFLDEAITAQYEQEAKTSSLLGFFALITLVVSALGLLGLSIFTAESKKKEIGVRKVLGASVSRIVNDLTGEFLFPVVLSLFIALPLGYYLMNEWLEQFAFKMPISFIFFLGSALVSICIAYATVLINSLKIANSNPVEAIKND